ncbi:helix-turn-helix transcriptional regulator [Mammaliicoccus sciuri]|uniref:helix-turn-helix domain-containing protein n=1 Tax=Mammaliicoccus sciuri TaxID=1296 RepID=UPI0030D2D47D
MTNFPENLSRLRKSYGLTLTELSDRLNKKYDIKFSKASIDRWEKGTTSPSMSHASALADYFDVTLDQLSGRDEIKIKPPNTMAAHLEGELDEKDVEYILGLIERLKRENKGE